MPETAQLESTQEQVRPYDLIRWGRNQLAAVAPADHKRYRDPHFSGKLREELRGTGVSYSRRSFRTMVDGVEKFVFAIFYVTRSGLDLTGIWSTCFKVLDALLLKTQPSAANLAPSSAPA